MRWTAVACLGLCLWFGATGAGQAATTQPVWQGEAFVTSVSDACAAISEAVGDFYRVVYRPKLSGTDPAEGLSFVGSRSAMLAISSAGSAMFQGSGPYKISGVGSHATSFGGTGQFQLTILPSPVKASTQVITITGSLTDFFASTGCTVQISAALVPRP